MDSKYKLIVDSFGEDRFKFNEPLKEYTSLSSDGKAQLLFIAFNQNELIRIVKMCRDLKLLFFIFGTGSKIMISDVGFPGLVIKNRTKNIQVVSVKGKVTKFGIGVDEALVEVESGLSINKFCEFLNQHELNSEEFKSIPGSIGGNLFLSRILQSKVKSIKVLDQQSQIDDVLAGNLNQRKDIILSAVFKISAKERY